DNPHQTSNGKGIVDSGCSRHVTGNKACLVYYQDFNCGPVTFGGSKGQIIGKGNSKMEADHAQEYYVLPFWSSYTSTVKSSKAKNRDEKLNEDTDSKTNEEPVDQEDQAFLEELERLKRQEKEANDAAKTLRKTFAQSTKDLLLQVGIARASSTHYDERGVLVRNKVRLVAHGHRQEEWIDYNEVFALVARIEAIRIFLAFASYMGFIVYQMDVKSAFLYGKINEEVRGLIDKTLFIKKDKKDVMLMSSMGELTFFLGLQVKQKKDGIFISQDKYVAEILKKFDFLNVKTASTLIETKKPKLLMWMFQYPKDSAFDLEAYSDSDYDRANLDRKSITIGCQFLVRRLISWQCKKQTIVATSTTKAEFVVGASCCGQVLWIQNQMLDYGFNFMNTKIYIDNESTICIVKNPVFHSKTKHIEIRHHFIMDAYEKKLIQVLKIHTNNNVADLLTKVFDVSRFNFLIVNIRMVTLLRLGKKMQFGLVLGALNEGEGSGAPTEPQPTPSPTHPSIKDQPPVTESSSSHDTTQDSKDSLDLEGTNRSEGDQGSCFGNCQGCSGCRDHFIKGQDKEAREEGRKKDKKDKLKPTLDDSTFDVDLDVDHGINYMDTKEPVNEGRLSEETEVLVSTARPEDNTVRPDVGTANPIAPPTTTTSIFDDENITMAQTLIKMKEEKAKEKGVLITDIEDSLRPARSILTLKPLPTIYPKDKGKGVLEEPEPAKKMTRRIEADELFAAKLQQEEREEYTIEEKKRVIDDFKPMDSNDAVDKEKVLEEPDSTKIEVKQEGDEESIRKRLGRRLKMKATMKSKRQKTDSNFKEEEYLKTFLQIVPDKKGEVDYEVLDKRFPIINWESKFYHLDRHGAECIYFRIFISDPKGVDLVLWGDLRTMFKETADDDLWKNQEEWILKSWNFYENCRVHTLTLEDGTEIYMLAERRYPFTKETLERMLALRLIVECESEAVFILLRFIQKQIDESGSHDGSEKDLKELAGPKQTAFGKDILNPLIVDSLLKTIWLSVHHVIAMKHWLYQSKRLL
nr:hypothetical protein [Tanacetum cinerariifolium]